MKDIKSQLSQFETTTAFQLRCVRDKHEHCIGWRVYRSWFGRDSFCGYIWR